MNNWYQINNPYEVITPGILLYPERIESNIREMIRIAGDVNRLRPHVKTYKIAEIVRMQIVNGIRKFKCATLAEAEMCAMTGAKDVLIAYSLFGAHIPRFARLLSEYPATRFSCLFDNAIGLKSLENVAAKFNTRCTVWLDVDPGMQRTGIPPGEKAFQLIQQAVLSPHLKFCGLHVYDGHHREIEYPEREKSAMEEFKKVIGFADDLTNSGIEIKEMVFGGSPTFPVHARNHKWSLSPGTCLLWDAGYGSKFKDLDFQIAAVLLTQVISKPRKNIICLDLGHKAIGSEMPHPRVIFPEIPEYDVITHNEEHLAIKTEIAKKYNPGDFVYGIPKHICPTMALHEWANVVRDGKVVEEWEIVARKRRISV